MKDPTNTLIGQTSFCDKIFHVNLFEREGFAPQVRIFEYATNPETLEVRQRKQLALRLGPAIEIANSILKGAALHRARINAEAASAEVSK